MATAWRLTRGAVVVLLVTGATAGCSASEAPILDSEITIPDLALRSCVENTLGLSSGEPITQTDLETLTQLECKELGIKSLSGLDTATSLTWLDLYANQIVDVSPLASLTNLTRLVLGGNQIVDVSPLAGLNNLRDLHLYLNRIVEVSPLDNLTNTDISINRWILNPQNGHKYTLTVSNTWIDAAQDAQDMGGHLVVVNNADEKAWLVSTFRSSESFWIGYSDLGTEGDWQWVEGISEYSNWDPGEPNDCPPGEDAAAMTNGTWNDIPVEGMHRGIVESDT